MATVGDQLTAPEPGWKRYDDNYSALKYEGNWTRTTQSGWYNSALSHTSDSNAKVLFKFYGTKIRIIGGLDTSVYRTDDIEITIDGVSEIYSEIREEGLLFQSITYEKLNLPLAIHTVTIKAGTKTNYKLTIDAIDIDDIGRIFHPDEITNVTDLDIGKRIRCNYFSYGANKLGIFRGLGQETANFIPSSSSTTPDGDFYFICADRDRLGRWKLIADRNIQSGISWDVLNNEGIASGSGVQMRPVEYIDYTNVIYVDAINGSDSNDGTQGNPVQSLNKAIQIARLNGIVYLNEGIYPINTPNGYLHDLCTKKHLTFIGQGLNTVIEVRACPRAYGQPSGTSAKFYNLVIRPSNTFTGDTRVIWYNSESTINFTLMFFNVAFRKSLDNRFPSSRYFYWSNSAILGVKAVFENCSFKLVPDGIEDVGTTRQVYINCVFENSKDANFRGTTINCFFGAVVDDSFYNNIDNTSIGVYGGNYSWNRPSSELLNNYNIYDSTIRLLTGGINSSDKDNEWDQYIVNSNLNGNITPGDNNVWNWNGVWSWTSTVLSTNASNRVTRGNTAVSGFNSAASSSTAGFRPVLLIEPLFKFDGAINKAKIHNENVILSGWVTETAGRDIQYKIEVNGIQVYPESGFSAPITPPFEIQHVIDNSYFNMDEENIIRIYITNGIFTDYYTYRVIKTNEPPMIETNMIGMKLEAMIVEEEGDAIQFNVYLNGNKIYPLGEEEYTEFLTPPISYNKIFKENEIAIKQNNVVTINVRDYLGAENTVTINFIGDYTGLMFMDGDGNYYSTGLGEILKYFDFGDINAGQTSYVAKIYIKNTIPHKLKNIRVQKADHENVLNIELSKTNSPFVSEPELFFDQTIDYGDVLEFYLKITPNILTYGEKTFDLFVEADPA